jgi:gluconate 2-dehydrogenase gamma chain
MQPFKDMNHQPENDLISRRELLRRAGFVGAAVTVIPVALLRGQLRGPSREPLETLSAAEGETLEAIVARLIPSDENGPGAAEARAAHYIDRALGGALSSSRDAYRGGLAALDAYSQATRRARFAMLPSSDQDAVLRDVEGNVATGFTPDAATFFNLVRAHTIQGTFCDPYYGGNASFVGWDLLGYPGVRLGVSASEQRLNPRLTATHRSAYDHSMFSGKRPARASVQRGHVHAG